MLGLAVGQGGWEHACCGQLWPGRNLLHCTSATPAAQVAVARPGELESCR